MKGTKEIRAVPTQKPTMSGDYLEGLTIPFNVVSEQLAIIREDKSVVLFREKIAKTALDGLNLQGVKCVGDHDEQNFFLGIAPKTLELTAGDDGLYYRCSIPPSKKQIVSERVERGEYEGNSFLFMVAENGDSWETMPDGTYLRTVNKISWLGHVGPVLSPAYKQTNLEVAQRSLEMYLSINVSVCVEQEQEAPEAVSNSGDMEEEDLRLKEMYYKSMC